MASVLKKSIQENKGKEKTKQKKQQVSIVVRLPTPQDIVSKSRGQEDLVCLGSVSEEDKFQQQFPHNLSPTIS